MFYVVYVTPEGFISTVHVADWIALKRLYDDISSRHGYSYVQMGAVGTGIITDTYTHHKSRFGAETDKKEPETALDTLKRYYGVDEDERA